MATFELDPGPGVASLCAVRGSVLPPVTGDDTFSISGDDTGLLYVSPDADPAHRKRVATLPAQVPERYYDWFAAQTSLPIHQDAGPRYAVEAWLANGEGVSHVSVAWTLHDRAVQVPIPTRHLRAASTPSVRPNSHITAVSPPTLSPDPQPPDIYGLHRLADGAHFNDVGGERPDLSYGLFVPRDSSDAAGQRPMLVYLHAVGTRGPTGR